MLYGVYENQAQVHWPPSKIFGDEIKVRRPFNLVVQRSLTRVTHGKIVGSFAQTYCFPRAIAYLESRKVDVSKMVSNMFIL